MTRPILYCASTHHLWPDELSRTMQRAVRVGASHLYLLPIHPFGGSRSLYAVRDLLDVNGRLFPSGWDGVRRLCGEAAGMGLGVVCDLVANHSSSDSPLVGTDPDLFAWRDGRIVHPGCWDNGHRVEWGDLAQHRFESERLRDYLGRAVQNLVDCGVAGFRCDAANQVPPWVWGPLIGEARTRAGRPLLWLAEALGCPEHETMAVAGAGFDLVTGSHAWWDGRAGWLPESVNRIRRAGAGVLGFLESHDTDRCGLEPAERLDRWQTILQWSDAALLVDGFERGCWERPVVVAGVDWVPARQPGRDDWNGFEDRLRRVNVAWRSA